MKMATTVNRGSRKRKSNSDLIFEVDEGDFSPPVTPEPSKEVVPVILNDTDTTKTSLEINKINPKENNDSKSECSISQHDEHTTTSKADDTPKTDADLRYVDMDVANSPPGPTNTEKPFVSIIFRDKDVALRVCGKIRQYIQNIINFEFQVESRAVSSDTALEFWDCKEETDDLNSSDADQTDKLDLFVVDTTPSKRRELLPRYTTANQCKAIGEPEKDSSTENSCRSTQTCFNCDGNHSMRDCTEARNMRKISLARNRFKAQQKSVRYHIDDDLKYKHLIPGKISEELRRALDVRKNELPPYIYRMRNLGYPPGWLQEAMVSNTKLELFDFEGCAVNEEQTHSQNIDSSKIIEYPGFNMPLEKGFKDEYKYFNCPPYTEKHSKSCMVEYIEQFSEKKIVQNDIPKKIAESDNSQESQDTEKRSSESPTLNDLELRKKQLLAELEDGSSNLNSPPSTNDATPTTKPPKEVIESSDVVSSSFGTPILKSGSPYVQLPDGDKFSKGICPVINFENLPDSTGKYEQMSAVIHKVRETVKNTKT